MDYLPIGTDVIIKDALKNGKISCVHIKENDSVSYDVVFWVDDERRVETFGSFEIRKKKEKKKLSKIGYTSEKGE